MTDQEAAQAEDQHDTDRMTRTRIIQSMKEEWIQPLYTPLPSRSEHQDSFYQIRKESTLQVWQKKKGKLLYRKRAQIIKLKSEKETTFVIPMYICDRLRENQPYCAGNHFLVKTSSTIAYFNLWTGAPANLKSPAREVTEIQAKIHPDSPYTTFQQWKLHSKRISVYSSLRAHIGVYVGHTHKVRRPHGYWTLEQEQRWTKVKRSQECL